MNNSPSSISKKIPTLTKMNYYKALATNNLLLEINIK
jgi:hypothetical protein